MSALRIPKRPKPATAAAATARVVVDTVARGGIDSVRIEDWAGLGLKKSLP